MAKAKAVAEVKKGTKFPMTLEEFHKKAKPVQLTVNGKEYTMDVRSGDNAFSSGGVGFFLGEKVTLDVGGTPVKFQMTFSLAGIGSKELAPQQDDEE